MKPMLAKVRSKEQGSSSLKWDIGICHQKGFFKVISGEGFTLGPCT